MTEEKMRLLHTYNRRRYCAADMLFRVTEKFMKGEMPRDVYCEFVTDTALQLREDYEDVKTIMSRGMTEPVPMYYGCWI